MSIVSNKRRKAKRKAERETKAKEQFDMDALRQKELHEMPEEMIQ